MGMPAQRTPKMLTHSRSEAGVEGETVSGMRGTEVTEQFRARQQSRQGSTPPTLGKVGRIVGGKANVQGERRSRGLRSAAGMPLLLEGVSWPLGALW